MTEYHSHPFPPAPALLLCQRCELALGHWDAARPLCPACHRVEFQMSVGE